MLDAGEHVLGRLEVGALESLDSRGGEQAAEEDILAAALDPAAPALVARDIDHRGEGPVDARARRFERCRFGGSPREIGLEARDFGERDGEDRAVAVDDVGGEDQRDLHPRLLDGGGLQDPRHCRAVAVEHAGELAAARFVDLLLEVGTGARRD